jgi:hypothetical protein
LVGTAAGLRLNWAFRQPRVTVAGNLPGAVPSPAARSNILRVINHVTQHAKLHIGTNQPRVAVGAFPGGASTIQTLDMDDIRNINASLAGQGTAKAFHEMMENFNAHGIGRRKSPTPTARSHDWRGFQVCRFASVAPSLGEFAADFAPMLRSILRKRAAFRQVIFS